MQNRSLLSEMQPFLRVFLLCLGNLLKSHNLWRRCLCNAHCYAQELYKCWEKKELPSFVKDLSTDCAVHGTKPRSLKKLEQVHSKGKQKASGNRSLVKRSRDLEEPNPPVAEMTSEEVSC